MVLVPCWAEADSEDSCIAVIVDAVLEVLGPLEANADVRQHTAELTERIKQGTLGILKKEMHAMQTGPAVSNVCQCASGLRLKLLVNNPSLPSAYPVHLMSGHCA